MKSKYIVYKCCGLQEVSSFWAVSQDSKSLSDYRQVFVAELRVMNLFPIQQKLKSDKSNGLIPCAQSARAGLLTVHSPLMDRGDFLFARTLYYRRPISVEPKGGATVGFSKQNQKNTLENVLFHHFANCTGKLVGLYGPSLELTSLFITQLSLSQTFGGFSGLKFGDDNFTRMLMTCFGLRYCTKFQGIKVYFPLETWLSPIKKSRPIDHSMCNQLVLLSLIYPSVRQILKL